MQKTIVCLWCNNRFDTIPDTGICPHCGYSHFQEVNLKIGDEYQGVILKMGDLSTLQSMRSGSIWFQSPQYYQNFKGNQTIGDINECAYDYIIDIPLEKIKDLLPVKVGDVIDYQGRQLEIREFKDAKVYVYSNTQNYNRLLCFYLLKIKNGILENRDKLLNNFGTHFCLVNIKKLSELIINYAKNNDIGCTNTTVKYTTKNYHGAYNPTCKDVSYAYQNEFRFILRGEKLNALSEEEPLKIKFEDEIMQDIMTEPKPLEELFRVKTDKQLFELFGIE